MPFPGDDRKQLLQAQDDARYYRERAAGLEEDNRRQQEQRYESDQRRRRERQSEIARSFRQAETWPEALRKQASLCRAEETEEDDYFTEMVAACELATDLWVDVGLAAAPAIAELERQIDALKAGIASTVADRLTEASASSAALEIASLMLDPDTDLDEWLNW
jgi:hypothetical protein